MCELWLVYVAAGTGPDGVAFPHNVRSSCWRSSEVVNHRHCKNHTAGLLIGRCCDANLQAMTYEGLCCRNVPTSTAAPRLEPPWPANSKYLGRPPKIAANFPERASCNRCQFSGGLLHREAETTKRGNDSSCTPRGPSAKRVENRVLP